MLVSFTSVTSAAESSDKCVRTNEGHDGWFDQTHNYLTEVFCKPAAWFDSFYENDRVDEEIRPGTRVRWRNDLVYSEGGKWGSTTKISAKFRLPKATDRIRLVFESKEEQTLGDLSPESEVEDEARTDLGILYEMFESPRAKFSIRVRLKPKLTLRYRYTLPTSKTFITQFTQEIFRDETVNGFTSRVDFEKRLTEKFILRWSNAGTIAEDFDGTEWSTALTLFQRLTAKSALSYEGSIDGVSEPVAIESNYRLGLRYRRNFYRKWLFYELVPEVTWPLDFVDNTREDEWAFVFRLEVRFDSF